MPVRWIVVSVLGLYVAPTVCLGAAEPKPDTARGDRQLEAYFRRETQVVADACLADVATKAEWERKRPELRRQFLEMMGLWPLPARTDLRPVVTGKLDAGLFTVEKLHFQSSPGLYVTANFYLPKDLSKPAPAILYQCGHSQVLVDKVSYGNKIAYQHHGIQFAEHGYACLVVDTLQLGEAEGLHHGTHHLNMWWWQTLGYTPAGIECWNAIRALDYLETRKEIDAKRIGVTGRSGGGAGSWWIAAADDRPKCIIPIAGIADLRAHLVEGATPNFRKGVISGHCDCMYFVNTYRWDFAQVAALCAPRPLMLGNSDADAIFPVAGYRRVAEKVRRIYDLFAAGDKFALLETAGPHRDTPELRLGALRWMNRWLKDDKGEVSEIEHARFTPQQLKVFDKLPADAINAAIHETFVKPARPELPSAPEVAREWWKGAQTEWRAALREKIFRGWPERAPALDVKQAADIVQDGLRLRAFDFISEENVPLRLWLLTAEKVEKPSLVVLTAVDETGWKEWARELGPSFKDALQFEGDLKRDDAKFEQNRRALAANKWAFATVAPRGIGPTRWAEIGTPEENHVKRRYALLGQTLDGQHVWDVRRGVAVLRTVADLKDTPLWLQGKGDMAGIVLYAALFEPDVVRLDLWDPPASHHDGPTFLNVRRFFDMPQALALAFPRAIRLYVKDDAAAKDWNWPLELQKSLGQEYLKTRVVQTEK
ncbi:MAG TPA: CocE/NonD family hydrolase [Gemmataceae bacterium]